VAHGLAAVLPAGVRWVLVCGRTDGYAVGAEVGIEGMRRERRTAGGGDAGGERDECFDLAVANDRDHIAGGTRGVRAGDHAGELDV